MGTEGVDKTWMFNDTRGWDCGGRMVEMKGSVMDNPKYELKAGHVASS